MFLMGSCDKSDISTGTTLETKPLTDLSLYSTAYFASGCFWCVEAVYESIQGVVEAESGFAGGQKANPTYGGGEGNHAETVKVYYIPGVVSYEDLLQAFFDTTNVTTFGQSPDYGKHYRSVLFPQNDEELALVNARLSEFSSHQVEVFSPVVFTKAAAGHQDYVSRYLAGESVGNSSYVRNVSIPRLEEFKATTSVRLKL